MNVEKILFHTVKLGIFTLSLLIPTRLMAYESPCAASLQYLENQYDSNQATRKAFEQVYLGLKDLPAGYSYNGDAKNPWKAAGSGKGMHRMMLEMFKNWCRVLPKIKGGSDNALDPILYFAWVYYQNPAGQDFVQGRDPSHPGKLLETGPAFLSQWNEEYFRYMNSKESAKLVPEWLEDPRIEINDYDKTKAADYTSWNDFFARNLKSDKDGSYPSRPVTMPERDYVIVSPTDCIMNPLVQKVEKSPGIYERSYIKNCDFHHNLTKISIIK